MYGHIARDCPHQDEPIHKTDQRVSSMNMVNQGNQVHVDIAKIVDMQKRLILMEEENTELHSKINVLEGEEVKLLSRITVLGQCLSSEREQHKHLSTLTDTLHCAIDEKQNDWLCKTQEKTNQPEEKHSELDSKSMKTVKSTGDVLKSSQAVIVLEDKFQKTAGEVKRLQDLIQGVTTEMVYGKKGASVVDADPASDFLISGAKNAEIRNAVKDEFSRTIKPLDRRMSVSDSNAVNYAANEMSLVSSECDHGYIDVDRDKLNIWKGYLAYQGIEWDSHKQNIQCEVFSV
jgi:hypothetical protein